MIIAGGDWQVPITRKAKEMGLYVISSNLYSDSPAFAYADATVVSDVLDRETNLEFARKYNVDAVITDQSDIAVPTVAYVCDQLGIPGITLEKAKLFTNKSVMREFCISHNFLSPKFKKCYEVGQAKEFLIQNGKMIIKPIDSQSSRGVFIIESVEQLEKVFDYSKKFSNAEKIVLAEEYIDGTEFTVDGIQTSNGYKVLAISEKKHYEQNPNVASELYFSHVNKKYDYERLKKTNMELVEAMELPFGLTHAEYKCMNGEFYLIEIAARGGGTKISSHIAPYMSGIDSNEALIRMALGEKIEDIPYFPKGQHAILKFLQFKAGKVAQIDGLDEIRHMDGVIDISLNFREGEFIQPMHDDRSRQGYYIVASSTEDQLNELKQQIEEKLHITYV